MQLPFLFHSCKDLIQELKIVPLVVGNEVDVVSLAEKIVAYSKDIMVIISSDMTHFGEDFGYVPFRYSVKSNVKDQDYLALDFVKKFDSKGFLKFVENRKMGVCGRYCVAVGLEVLNFLECTKSELLCYYTSSDVVKNEMSFVSYAAMGFV